MGLRTTGIIALVIAIAAGLTLFTTPARRPAALPQAQPDLAAYNRLIQSTAGASWASQPSAAAGGRVTAFMQLDLAPLALVGRSWGHEQRAAYAAELAAAQRRLAAGVARAGGSVVASFSHAAAGLAVSIDPAHLPALHALPGVAAVVRVSDYTTSQAGEAAAFATQAELTALIGADEVQRRGNDGTGIEIAIVDSGVDYTHLKLGGSGNQADYDRAVCGIPGPGESGCDPRFAPPADLFPNTKIRGGLDFVGDIWPNPDPRCGTQGACPVFDTNPIDMSGHGTHIADIAAGRPTVAGGGDGGVAPGANLWAFKACNGASNLCNGPALLSAIDAALDLDRSDSGACAVGAICKPYDPADIIVLGASFGYGQPEDAVTLFANLASFYGSLVVAAAGNDGDRPYIIGAPAVASATLAVGESALPDAAGEAMAAGSSRGPRIADNGLKPDLAAPGAIISAQAGGGSAVAPFDGTSGAAPVAAGVAALVIQQLERQGVIDPDPGLADGGEPRLSLGPLVKAVLMNNAAANLRAPAGGLAPFTLQGSGRINARASFLGRTLAIDATPMIQLIEATPELQSCTIKPYIDLLAFRLLGVTPPCASLYPGGDPLFQAWNAQTGSVSFGYRPVLEEQVLTRQVAVLNYSRSPRSYSLSTALRFADDEGRGVTLGVTPDRLTLAGGASELVTLTLTLSPRDLRDWTLNGGELGDRGSATCVSPTPERDCPSLTLFEADGALLIDGGVNNQISLPVHVLPRRVAAVTVAGRGEGRLLLANGSAFKEGAVSPFALVEVSPNTCDTRGASESCADPDYTPGELPGSNASPVDIRYVGLRSYARPGLNEGFGLPPAPAGALADEVVEFAVTVYDKPFRASPNFPVRFEIHIDADANGTVDAVAYNADRGGGRDGRSMTFVRQLNGAGGPTATPYLFTQADFNTQSWVLPVPAAAAGLRSDRPFRFYVLAFDAYFEPGETARPWDCSPGPPNSCGGSAHTMQTGSLRLRPATTTLTVPPAAQAELVYSPDAGGAGGSPSQLGLLLLFRDALPGQGAEAVTIP